MTTKKILVIGCGGIGSYLAGQVYRLIMKGQIDGCLVTLADPDSVEVKNIKYQDFDKKDVLENKAKVLGKRFGFCNHPKRINDETELTEYDMIVCCVDNSGTRKLVYDYCYKNGKPYIDLRSNGRNICYFTQADDQKEVTKLLGEISQEGTSCQIKAELDAGIIQNGNVIVATIGSQLILNWLRNEEQPKGKILRI